MPRSDRCPSVILTLFMVLALGASCADDTTMDEPMPEPGEYAAQPLYCSTSAIEGIAPMMAWRLEVVPGGRCHQVVMRFDVAGHRDGEQPVPVETIEEESVAVGPVGVEGATLSFGDASLDVVGVDGHPGLWRGTFFRADESFAISCFSSIWQPRYQYDASSGRCADAQGATGMNPIPVPVVRDSGIGECADLRGMMLNENDLSYPEWRGFDLRGADLSDAQLSFAHIYDAALGGTRLTTLTYGYAYVTGTLDAFTSLPSEGSCTVDGDRVECVR